VLRVAHPEALPTGGLENGGQPEDNGRMKRRFSLGLRFLALLGSAAHPEAGLAQVALSPVAVVGTSPGSFGPTVPPERMIDQSGVTTPFTSGVTVFDQYFANPGQTFATSGNGGVHNWQSEVSFTLPLAGYVDFDLGATYRLNRLALWNRSLKNVTVKVRKELNGPEQVAGSYTLFSRLSFPFSYAVDVLTFNQVVDGRYVRVAFDSVHTFNTTDTFGYAIVGEVVLSAAPVTDTPQLSVVLEANGDVTLSFVGTLQAAPTADGTFVPVPGSPQRSYTLPKGSLAGAQYFRAQGQ
jgi:hypothetical protein